MKKFTGWLKTENEADSKWLVYLEDGYIIYGFNYKGEYFYRNNPHSHEEYEIEKDDYIASKEEIEKQLIEHAKQQGYIYEIYKFSFFDNQLIGKNKNKSSEIIFNNGVWVNQIQVKEPELVDTTNYKLKYFEACVEKEKLKQQLK